MGCSPNAESAFLIHTISISLSVTFLHLLSRSELKRIKYFFSSKMIVKPLQISGGMQAQVQLSAAALEDDRLTNWQCHSLAAEPLLQQLSALWLFSTLNFVKSWVLRADITQSFSLLKLIYSRDALVKAQSAHKMCYPKCNFPFVNKFWPPPSLGGMTGKQLIFEISTIAWK